MRRRQRRPSSPPRCAPITPFPPFLHDSAAGHVEIRPPFFSARPVHTHPFCRAERGFFFGDRGRRALSLSTGCEPRRIPFFLFPFHLERHSLATMNPLPPSPLLLSRQDARTTQPERFFFFPSFFFPTGTRAAEHVRLEFLPWPRRRQDEDVFPFKRFLRQLPTFSYPAGRPKVTRDSSLSTKNHLKCRPPPISLLFPARGSENHLIPTFSFLFFFFPPSSESRPRARLLSVFPPSPSDKRGLIFFSFFLPFLSMGSRGPDVSPASFFLSSWPRPNTPLGRLFSPFFGWEFGIFGGFSFSFPFFSFSRERIGGTFPFFLLSFVY